MPDKPKVAFYWCASCGGCEESIVDLAEDILGVLNAVDIVFWPVAMDFKKTDVDAIADGGILVSMINGAVRTSEQEEMARLLRRKSKLVIAYGACAHTGGIPGLANQFEREQILRYVYEDSPSTVNPGHTRPQTASAEDGRTVTLPEFRSMVRTLDQVISVDYYLPGCPPVPRMLKAAIGGCGAQCITGNMPCGGCFGPTSNVRDQGAKILSAIASSVSAKESDGIDAILASIPDPVGTFYRYGLPGSLLRRKIEDHH